MTELSELSAKATQGVWEADSDDGWIFVTIRPLTKYIIAEMQSSLQANEAYITALVNAHRAGRLVEQVWLPIESAPYNTPVRIKAGNMTFIARLLPDAIEDENGACDQWQAEHEGEHPPCWSGSACWASNENEDPSLQPEAWQPVEAGSKTDG